MIDYPSGKNDGLNPMGPLLLFLFKHEFFQSEKQQVEGIFPRNCLSREDLFFGILVVVFSNICLKANKILANKAFFNGGSKALFNTPGNGRV